MAHYLVSARPRRKRMGELQAKLREGAFQDLSPFGRELSQALTDAREMPDGRVIWEEEDYCSPPLAQEREAVLDHFFEEIEVQDVAPGAGWEKIDGLPPLFPDLRSGHDA